MIRIGGVALALAVLAMLVVDLWVTGPDLAQALRIAALVQALAAAVLFIAAAVEQCIDSQPDEAEPVDVDDAGGPVPVAQLLARERRADEEQRFDPVDELRGMAPGTSRWVGPQRSGTRNGLLLTRNEPDA